MEKRVSLWMDFDADYERLGHMGGIERLSSVKSFVAKEEWDLVKRYSTGKFKSWVDDYLKDTAVTVLLISEETAKADYISYMIKESIKRGNGILGINIHKVKDSSGRDCSKGDNPLEYHYVMVNGRHRKAMNYFKTYTWSNQKNRLHLETWIEEALELSKEI